MPRPGEVISHWHYFVENFNTSTLDFYNALDKSLISKQSSVRAIRVDYGESGILSAKREYLRATYGRYSLDIAAFPFGRDFFFSWWLTKRRPDSVMLVALGALFALVLAFVLLVKATGLVYGVWLFASSVAAYIAALANGAVGDPEVVDDIMFSLPIIGTFWQKYVRPATYFSEDTRIIFQEAVHALVLHEIQGVLAAKGAKALAPDATTPYSWPPIGATGGAVRGIVS
jgi:hypothetical protein